MSHPPALAQPDFNQLAADFERYLPHIHPVALALLDHLPPPATGETVLDVACGTGEPGLTLARRLPGAHVLGVDSAPAMIAIAQRKAELEALANARFEVMSSEALALADESVDAVISRFGVMMFGDVPASAREIGRVLRTGGHFSLAVWDDMTKNTLVHSVRTILREHLPKEHASPMDALNEWAAEGVRARLLEEAGLRVVGSEMFSWIYRFENFEEVWNMVSAMGKLTGQAALSPDAQQNIKRELGAPLAAYRQPAGEYFIPHACRLFWGQR